jgi:hypothetical protein
MEMSLQLPMTELVDHSFYMSLTQLRQHRFQSLLRNTYILIPISRQWGKSNTYLLEPLQKTILITMDWDAFLKLGLAYLLKQQQPIAGQPHIVLHISLLPEAEAEAVEAQTVMLPEAEAVQGACLQAPQL